MKLVEIIDPHTIGQFRLKTPSKGPNSYFPPMIKTPRRLLSARLEVLGGEGGSRTLARVTPSKALAKPPLEPLGYFSVNIAMLWLL